MDDIPLHGPAAQAPVRLSEQLRQCMHSWQLAYATEKPIFIGFTITFNSTEKAPDRIRR